MVESQVRAAQTGDARLKSCLKRPTFPPVPALAQALRSPAT
ncbi:hypothetical protein ANT2_1154 [plant metagenome]|uniref:Uncharacterized protein n=1 Tax=plant metagenome TaxID=1297885 RepID=A0A484TEG7_9ZZZZ